jgi:hypothetical protein
MIVITYIVAVIVFAWAFVAIRLPTRFSSVMSIVNNVIAVLRDKTANDREKEKATQSASLALFRQAAIIVIHSIIVILFASLPLWLADFVGVASMNDSLSFAVRWDVLLVTLIVMTAGWYLWPRQRNKKQ